MSEDTIRLTDKVGVVGIGATAYGEYGEHVTTVDASLLTQGIELLETLGWEEVDVCTVDSERSDYPMLVLRPPCEPLFTGDQAGIAITPKTEKGRNDE